ncbi:MAG: hypothetical protein KBC38_03160 [Candidatus Pacebacteria bacterium]|nr:hypothetical protein [Candidatus Paceibacterota bacterium]MBP9840590.1 hypothetical protein [Candidatus Paceibacterota bacterium]
MNTSYLWVIGLILILVGSGIWLMQGEIPPATPDADILSFADCAEAGYPVMESYPRQCRTPDGRTFAEEIVIEPTYVNASPDLITVSTPTPGAVTGKPLIVKGEARGTWYFEASFPIEVEDADGNVIANGYAEAEGEWMTEEFVPFTAAVTIPAGFIGDATLIIKNSNASGEPERDRSLSFPIRIEY